MNYIYFKNHFPKTCQRFFEWVSKMNPNEQNDYVDNTYFYKFVEQLIGNQWDKRSNYYLVGSGAIYICNKKHIELILPQLDNKLKKRIICLNRGQKYYEDFNICLDRFTDTQEEFLRINATSENDFISAFKCLEILLNNGYYA